MSITSKIQKDGFVILKNIFTESEINDCRDEILSFIDKHNVFKSSGGISIPNFIQHENLCKTSQLKDDKNIQDALIDIFGTTNYRFCSHNDIGINRIVGWHKDRLNNEYRKYESVDIWKKYKGDQHEIFKVLIYLQNHQDNKDGLKIVPGSHLNSSIETKKNIQLKPGLGDVIIFDQRITHRGMEKQVKQKRILVSFGFGKNNIFTDNFEKGTVIRQNKQCKV